MELNNNTIQCQGNDRRLSGDQLYDPGDREKRILFTVCLVCSENVCVRI